MDPFLHSYLARGSLKAWLEVQGTARMPEEKSLPQNIKVLYSSFIFPPNYISYHFHIQKYYYYIYVISVCREHRHAVVPTWWWSLFYLLHEFWKLNLACTASSWTAEPSHQPVIPILQKLRPQEVKRFVQGHAGRHGGVGFTVLRRLLRTGIFLWFSQLSTVAAADSGATQPCDRLRCS